MTIAPSHKTDPRLPRRQFYAVAAVLALMTVLRMIYAARIDLRTDEAYYWTWSKENVLSFLDHPPMIAWFIRFGTAVFGDTNFGARFACLLAMLASQFILADIVRRVTRDIRAVVLALLMLDAAVYYGLLMAKLAPDVALIPFALAMVWSLIRVAETDDGRWWLLAGVFGGLALLSKFTAVMLAPAVLAFIVVPDWRRRWLLSPYPWLAALIAIAIFSPVLIWNAMHDWASFKFQFVRAAVTHQFSAARFGEFLGLQFSLVGPVLFPVTLSGVAMMTWRGVRRREGVSILLATCVAVPFLYFLWRSLTLRIGDTWPMFMWPIGFAAAAVNLAWMIRQPSMAKLARSSVRWAGIAVVSGIAIVILTFYYYVFSTSPLLGRLDPGGAEAGYEQVAARAQEEMAKTGATWIATMDYRTYAELRWWLKDRVPVIQINERGRFIGFKDPGMDLIRGHTGLYVARKSDENNPLWSATSAVRQPLGEVTRTWRGITMDTYVLQKVMNWTPELAPAPDAPLFRVHPVAENARAVMLARATSE
jgi:4-amino-4-deoxy-L-arabinose transferase-like glycosyltransferase